MGIPTGLRAPKIVQSRWCANEKCGGNLQQHAATFDFSGIASDSSQDSAFWFKVLRQNSFRIIGEFAWIC